MIYVAGALTVILFLGLIALMRYLINKAYLRDYDNAARKNQENSTGENRDY